MTCRFHFLLFDRTLHLLQLSFLFLLIILQRIDSSCLSVSLFLVVDIQLIEKGVDGRLIELVHRQKLVQAHEVKQRVHLLGLQAENVFLRHPQQLSVSLAG